MKVKTCNDDDNVLIAWKPDGMIPDCRGFALLRRRNGVEEVVSTWVGFEGQDHEEVSGDPPPIGRSKNISGLIAWRLPAIRFNIACFQW